MMIPCTIIRRALINSQRSIQSVCSWLDSESATNEIVPQEKNEAYWNTLTATSRKLGRMSELVKADTEKTIDYQEIEKVGKEIFAIYEELKDTLKRFYTDNLNRRNNDDVNTGFYTLGSLHTAIQHIGFVLDLLG